MTARAWIACAIWALASGVRPAAAQDIAGALQGTAVSAEGKPEPEVRVSVSGPNLQGSRETTTDRTGFFQLLLLPPGRYTLKLTRVGLRSLDVREAVVELGRTTTVGALTIEPQPIELAPVVVSRAPLKLDPVSTTAGGNLIRSMGDRCDLTRAVDALRAPVLVIQGDHDTLVRMAEAPALARAGASNLTELMVVEGAGHGFQAGDVLRRMPQPLLDMTEATAAWMRRWLLEGAPLSDDPAGDRAQG